jgi:hypothetical protein
MPIHAGSKTSIDGEELTILVCGVSDVSFVAFITNHLVRISSPPRSREDLQKWNNDLFENILECCLNGGIKVALLVAQMSQGGIVSAFSTFDKRPLC